MIDDSNFRHLGGGRKGLFLLLRYLFIVAASYLVVFQTPSETIAPASALMVAVALASNVALSFAPERLIFAWYVEAPVLIADTLWVSWALNTSGTIGQEFFLLYFFVLFLSTVGENLVIVLLISTAVSAANVYFASGTMPWTASNFLRVVFFYTVALFYGYVVSQIKGERRRADRGLAWAKELEAKVAERTEELRRLYHESLAANRLKSEFVSTMSHELRTPLGIIKGYVELLLDDAFGTLNAAQVETLRMIDKRSRELFDLINATLDLNRLDAGKLPVELKEINLADLLRALDTETHDLRDKPSVHFAWNVDPDLPPLSTDPAKLKVILRNLILNAVKFTTHGSVTVRADGRDGGVEICVEDTGIGIAPVARALIFEPFRQGDGSITRRYGGVGLGLYIVRRLVDLLGGTITVESEVGKGSTFRVWVPSSPAGHIACDTVPVAVEAPRGGSLRPFRQFGGAARIAPTVGGAVARSAVPEGMPLATPARERGR
jgi:signal transduction histidine kinase